MNKNLTIEYRFLFDNQSATKISVELDPESLELVAPAPTNPPDWAKLEFEQCPNCPLKPKQDFFCPLALHLVKIIPQFEPLTSFDQVEVEVLTEERKVSKHTSVQRALSSLMGLIIATSGCPHTKFFRAMARFHQPFSCEEETLLRASAIFLLAQYFIDKKGINPDFELNNLKKIYQDIAMVNQYVAKRLKAASNTDSSPNALILLDLHAKAMPYVIDDSLEELKYLFVPYFKQLGL